MSFLIKNYQLYFHSNSLPVYVRFSHFIMNNINVYVNVFMYVYLYCMCSHLIPLVITSPRNVEENFFLFLFFSFWGIRIKCIQVSICVSCIFSYLQRLFILFIYLFFQNQLQGTWVLQIARMTLFWSFLNTKERNKKITDILIGTG